jgi:hypothetical protein
LARAVHFTGPTNIDMKAIHHLTSVFVTAGSIGVTFLTLGGYLPAEEAFAGLAVMGLAAFALFDYTRPLKPLAVAAPAPVLRPPLPAASAGPVARTARRVPAIVERVA